MPSPGAPPPRAETTPPGGRRYGGRWGKLPPLSQSRAVEAARRDRMERERLTRAFGDARAIAGRWPVVHTFADRSTVHRGDVGLAWIGPDGAWLAFAPRDSFASRRSAAEQVQLARARAAVGSRDVGELTRAEVGQILSAAVDPYPLDPELVARSRSRARRTADAPTRAGRLVDRARAARDLERAEAERQAAQAAAAIRAERERQTAAITQPFAAAGESWEDELAARGELIRAQIERREAIARAQRELQNLRRNR